MELEKKITLPQNSSISFLGNNFIQLEGPLGYVKIKVPKELILNDLKIPSGISFSFNSLNNKKVSSNKIKALLNTFEAIFIQGIHGVFLGHRIQLELVGVGFRANIESKNQTKTLLLKLGYSHDINLTIPETLEVLCPKPNLILIKGCDKQQVFNFASIVQKYKTPEPYKGKGILRRNEVIRRKEGKRS
jgi:large subunit ribosomal protein L6